MAALAYLFVECVPGHARGVLSRPKRVAGTRGAYTVTGHYDIIAIIEAPDAKAISELVLSKVQSISGMHKTTTNLVVE
jgi:DNA-binding Lrp family transcriptional regulator